MKKPDDFHVHLRDGASLQTTVPHCANQFARALVMPNLVPPITNVEGAHHYRKRILEATPKGTNFTPLMSLYLTDETSSDTIRAAKNSDFIFACKLYPAGATTNSASGVTDIKKIYSIFETMQSTDLPLLVHGEVTDPDVDIFDREQVFLEKILTDIIKNFPDLRIVVEHITTKNAVDFVLGQNDKIAATITPHHLYLNRNDLLAGGIRPHNYCLPVAKRRTHQEALIKAATSDSPKFFLGTDSAPHKISKKESSCGCAGIYSAPIAIELYAQIFDQVGCLEKLEAFASKRGAHFYHLDPNEGTITIEKKSWEVPKHFEFDDETIVPFFAGRQLSWKII